MARPFGFMSPVSRGHELQASYLFLRCHVDGRVCLYRIDEVLIMTIAAWKLALPVLPPSCCVHFPDKPLVWHVRGTHRLGGRPGTSASCNLHTHASASQETAKTMAEEACPWLKVETVAAIGWSKRP